MSVLRIVIVLIRGIVADRSELAAEDLALRQQLVILEQRSKRPRLRKRDRVFWAWLSRFWPNWRSVLVIVLNEAHLRRILSSYFAYYHESRAHLSLGCDAPVPRRVEHPSEGKVIAIPQVGGLHHRYRRAA